MARLAPSAYSYDPNQYAIPAEARDLIHGIVRRGPLKFREFTFTEADFRNMAEGLSIAESVYRTRRESFDQKVVANKLKCIARLSKELVSLLYPEQPNP